jgi:hypothetical protein
MSAEGEVYEFPPEPPESVLEAARLSEQEGHGARVFSCFDEAGVPIEDCLADSPEQAARRSYVRLMKKDLYEGSGENWNKDRKVWVAGRGLSYLIVLRHVSRAVSNV